MFTPPANVKITVLPMTFPSPIDSYTDQVQKRWASRKVIRAVNHWAYQREQEAASEGLSAALGEDWWATS